MRFVAGLLLGCCIPAFGGSSSVSLILSYDHRPSAVAEHAMARQLTDMMKRAGIDIFFKSPEKPASNSHLVVVRMHGYCGMDRGTSNAASSKPLASTVVTNGEVLPFADLDCDQIRSALVATYGSGNPQHRQFVFGAATARVMAHELYHVMGSTAHTDVGVTRERLSGADLADPRLSLPDEAVDTISGRSSAAR
jgi:hypothetical protein